jgi:type I restriction enzyme, S subunit
VRGKTVRRGEAKKADYLLYYKPNVPIAIVEAKDIPVLVQESKQFCVQRHIGILRPSRHIEHSYLAYALASGFVFRQANQIATGIAQKTVPLAGLRRITIPLPRAEQKRIVAKVDELMALCDRLEA